MKNYIKNLRNRASVLLVSMIIICAITLLMAVTLSEVTISSGYQRTNTTELKVSYYAAESCLEETLMRLELDPSFSGTSITLQPDLICQSSVSGGIIDIVVDNLDYSEIFRAEYDMDSAELVNNIDLENWKEDDSF
ncbi:MAG: hypothetical protein WC846_04100 [Candidatus Gracilibacteria bacterium]|jgi:hypothetical protein